MDDFVRNKLTEWGLSEYIETFKDEGIDEESFYCLDFQDIANLIPKVGRRAIFKKRLMLLKGEDNTTYHQESIDSPPQFQREKEEAAESDQVLPSTSGTKDKGKRKLDLQGESSKWPSPPSKRQRTSGLGLYTEEIILSDVKSIMRFVQQRLPNQDSNINRFLRNKISDLETDKRVLVGVFGKTGAGKSSLINAVIGEKNLLPSGSISACTSVMIKVEANMKSPKYEADIEFITKEEWKDELWSLLNFLGDNADQGNDQDEEEDYRDIDEKLSAVYGEEWRSKSAEDLMDNKYFKEIPEFLQSKRKILTCESAKELSAKCVKYTKNDSKDGDGKDRKRWYWPLVKCVTVRVPKNYLLQHVTIVDLPGTGDRNKSRDEMWKSVVESCSTVWIVTELNRAAAEKETWEILKSASSIMGNGGECQQIHFICTKSDNIEDSDDSSAAGVRALIFKKNMKAKEEVNKEFKKLNKVKKHFGDDCFKVFTVSSKEFFKKRHLEPDETEIPKLQEFLQNLNDCHSETFNYVSGAYGILSLIQGARHTEVAGKKNEVCTELNENKRRECYEVQKSMNDTEIAFRKYLSKGVENSKKTCQEKLESNLNPKGVSGRGFHRILKCVVRNHGTYKPKNKKQINLNETLASCLTDSIDEEFRKTFPNERKCKPFNGVINKFSLDTKSLIERFTDVKLQLIFLKTEEIKMKTKLNKEIRDRKKKIYNSLTERIEKSMKECYEKAAGFKGEDTLKNMKETIMKHVLSSKDIMFEQAKEEMLSRLRDLMDYILKTLEETMQKSIELSLKTDDYPLPDFEAELEEVQKYYNDLKKRQEEETPQICFALLGEAADA
uniref:Nuclear GTPase SLIP-GC-like n=1 Tax=Sparus aurata TaxID=8175 RepID=A0A671Y207_SPAAU